MKKFILLTLTPFLVASAYAQTVSSEFATPRDFLRAQYKSNINLQNNQNASVTVYGLYVRQFAYVAPGESCEHAHEIYLAAENLPSGSFVTPTTIASGKSAVIGSNYLYNMIYGAIYHAITTATSPCELPGCTWGNDSTIYNWCIYLGALAPVAVSTGYTANVPPSTEEVSDVGIYDYSLTKNYAYIGPISCNDNTLTCAVTTLQTQSFS